MKLCITGANSHVGRNLLGHLKGHSHLRISACVRSESSLAALPTADNITPVCVAYDDATGLRTAMREAGCVIHLAGILLETRHSNYASANVAATAAVVHAAKAEQVRHLVFVSAIGADIGANNAYFRSKGHAEQLVASGGIASTVLRTPMLLGPDSAGARALLAAARRPKLRLPGGGLYTMRPLDTDDLSAALIKLSLAGANDSRILELAGPEPIRYRALIQRTARLMGRNVAISAVPVLLVKLGAALGSSLRGGGITPTVIDVITGDEIVAKNADGVLGIALSSLDETLHKILRSE